MAEFRVFLTCCGRLRERQRESATGDSLCGAVGCLSFRVFCDLFPLFSLVGFSFLYESGG